MDNENPGDGSNLLELATELTVAWLANPNTRVSADEVPSFLQKIHGAVSSLVTPQEQAESASTEASEYTPAVSVRRSLASKDYIVSMIDGKPYKTLKRHLARHGLTPAEYRARYHLRTDYPMVAENYGAMRRELAKSIGLGRKPAAASSNAGDADPAKRNVSRPGHGKARKSAKARGDGKSQVTAGAAKSESQD